MAPILAMAISEAKSLVGQIQALVTKPPTAVAAPVSLDAECWETTQARALARKWAVCLNIPTKEAGGKSFRIRGATDVAAMHGAADGARLVQQIGRWHSDVAFIYSRAQAGKVLEASGTMANAEGGSLESLIPGWAQPAARPPR